MYPLNPWMKFVLRLAGTYNVLAGFSMLALYHEGFKLLGLPKPELVLPVQLVGVLVALFGVGYHLVASDPLANRNLLVLGFWSKAIGSLLGVYYVIDGQLPPSFLALLVVSDIAYLPPFALIIRHLNRAVAAERSRSSAPRDVTSQQYLTARRP